MGFEESWEGAVWFGSGPAAEWFCVASGEFGLDAKGQQSSLGADRVEDFAVDLEAFVDWSAGQELHMGGLRLDPRIGRGLVSDKFAAEEGEQG